MTSVLVNDGFAELFCAARAGEASAVHALVEEFFEPVERYLARRGVSDAESLANHVVYQAIRRGDPARISNRLTFQGFLFTIARNQVADDRRHRTRRVTIDLVDDPADARFAPILQAPAAESVALGAMGARDLLALVNPDQAEVLELRLLDGQTLESTAEILGKSVPAVTSLHYRGLAHLRRVVLAALAVALVVVGGWAISRDAQDSPVISENIDVPDPAPVDPPSPDGAGRVVPIPTPDVPKAPQKSENRSITETAPDAEAPIPVEPAVAPVARVAPASPEPAIGAAGAALMPETTPVEPVPLRPSEPTPAVSVAEVAVVATPSATAAESAVVESAPVVESAVVVEAADAEESEATVESEERPAVVAAEVEESDPTPGRGVDTAPANGIRNGAGCEQGSKNSPNRPATCADDLSEVIAKRGNSSKGV